MPTLFIWGSEDGATPLVTGHQTFEKVGTHDKRFVTLDGAAHETSLTGPPGSSRRCSRSSRACETTSADESVLAMLFFALTLVLADLPPPPAECRKDAECELTTFVGCCGACCPGLRAAPKGKDERAACKTMNCAPIDCATVNCKAAPDAARFVAACVERRCEAVRTDAECRVAADCTLVDTAPQQTTCAKDTCCCPVKVALPRAARAPAPVASNARCPDCPPPPPTRTACVEGRCEAVTFNPNSKKR